MLFGDEFSQIKEFKNTKKYNSYKNFEKINDAKKKFFKVFKKNFQSKDFIPVNYFIDSKTSSHYAGDSNFIKKEILQQNENHYKKNVFFNDSLLWNNLPSESPTFTIMANAMRITDLYL